MELYLLADFMDTPELTDTLQHLFFCTSTLFRQVGGLLCLARVAAPTKTCIHTRTRAGLRPPVPSRRRGSCRQDDHPVREAEVAATAAVPVRVICRRHGGAQLPVQMAYAIPQVCLHGFSTNCQYLPTLFCRFSYPCFQCVSLLIVCVFQSYSSAGLLGTA